MISYITICSNRIIIQACKKHIVTLIVIKIERKTLKSAALCLTRHPENGPRVESQKVRFV